jgi:hypothetical protein
MQVSPSVVVDIVDELERRAALRRIRDQVDRRRQMVEPTDAGVSLANECLRISQQLDRELLAPFNDEAGRADLRRALSTLLKAHNVLQPGPLDRSGLTSRPNSLRGWLPAACKGAPTALMASARERVFR